MGSSRTTDVLNGIPPFMKQFYPSCHCAMWQSSITTCFSQSQITGLCTTTLCNFNFCPGALFSFRKNVVRVLELDSCISRRCTMQLSEIQLQLNFCCQLQTALVPSDAQLSCYSCVATICDIQKLMRSLKLRKISGIDGIPYDSLRHFPSSPLVHLKHLFNDIFGSGISQSLGRAQKP
jgi:hypothetical protein